MFLESYQPRATEWHINVTCGKLRGVYASYIPGGPQKAEQSIF